MVRVAQQLLGASSTTTSSASLSSTTTSSSSSSSSSHAPPISLAQWTQQDFDRAVQDAKIALEANEAAIKQIVDQHMRSSGRHTGQATMRGSAAQHTEMLQYEHTFWPAYQGSLLPFFREICQNAADAGASQIRFEQRQRNTMLYAGDNGSGMSFNTLSRKFLDSEVSDKRSKAAAGGRASAAHPVGGFGIGRRIILFCHEAWVLRTRSYLVVGLYDRYVLHCAHCGAGVYDASACGCGGPAAAGPATRGTEMLIKKSVSKRDMSDVEKLFFSFWHVPGIEVVLNGTVAPSLAWPPAIDNVAGHFSVHEAARPPTARPKDSFYMICTHQGIPMFLDYDPEHTTKGWFVVRLAASKSAYTSFNPARTEFHHPGLEGEWQYWLSTRRTEEASPPSRVQHSVTGKPLSSLLSFPRSRSTKLAVAERSTGGDEEADAQGHDVGSAASSCRHDKAATSQSDDGMGSVMGLSIITVVSDDMRTQQLRAFQRKVDGNVLQRLLLSWSVCLYQVVCLVADKFKRSNDVCRRLCQHYRGFEVGLIYSGKTVAENRVVGTTRYFLINPTKPSVLKDGCEINMDELLALAVHEITHNLREPHDATFCRLMSSLWEAVMLDSRSVGGPPVMSRSKMLEKVRQLEAEVAVNPEAKSRLDAGGAIAKGSKRASHDEADDAATATVKRASHSRPSSAASSACR